MVEYGVFILLVCACLDISYLLFYVLVPSVSFFAGVVDDYRADLRSGIL